ncbi:MAG TPA: hypothetical protein VF599_05050 [Pyrinomonadaceae bacterium]|jgi:hypothetical protein
MKDNSKPNMAPLLFIIAGSCLLALPGIYGAFFLFMFAFEGGPTNPLALLLPLPPVIGFLLLFGYIWTAVTKRFVGWLWAISFFFNLIVSATSALALVYFFMETRQTTGYEILFILFIGWTIFVTAVSGRYFAQSRAANKANLP